MRELLRGIVGGVIALLVLGAIASRLGWIVTDVRPVGHAAWLLSRATGIVAYLALALDVVVGLAVSTRTGDRWVKRAHAIDLHGWLSPLALALVAGHALVLLADRYVRFDVIDVAVPFAASWHPFAVGLGVVAAYLALVVHASFAFRKRIGAQTWRRLHYLSFVAFAAGGIHAVLAGSDVGRPWAIAILGLPAAIIAALVVRRATR